MALIAKTIGYAIETPSRVYLSAFILPAQENLFFKGTRSIASRLH